ncbi:MAG: hypothetical protein ACLPYS_20510 [Vulcanimicrobiaceae bacterium]|jgi:hypothetical protein
MQAWTWYPYIFGSRDGVIKALPESLLLRDGTTILTDPTPLEQDPYVVDWLDGRFVLVDGGRAVEEVDLWPKPAYYGKQTSSGLPMSHIVSARPQRLNVFQSSFCYFWADGNGCRYCDIVTHTKQQRQELGVPSRLRLRDVKETVAEAIREPGRFTNICLTVGSAVSPVTRAISKFSTSGSSTGFAPAKQSGSAIGSGATG